MEAPGAFNEFLGRLERMVGGKLNDKLIRQALTHPSAANEGESRVSNQRLEFLGDAVLDLAVGEWEYQLFPEADEGWLTRLRASIVCGTELAEVALALGVDRCLILGKGEEARGGRKKRSILSAALEALVGALFLELGYARTSEFVRKVIRSPEEAAKGRVSDFKSDLQEKLQAKGSSVVYRVEDVLGAPHERRFRVVALVDGGVVGFGEGTSKKEAQQKAAEDALKHLREMELNSKGAD